MSKRKNPNPTQRERLFEANAHRCCVCKSSGIGLHLHHIDGDNSNTVDENLAVLCVEDHDHHHRPDKYPAVNHLDISSKKLLEYKNSWESFVADGRSDNPTVIAVVNVFGTYEHIHAAKIVFQWPDEKVEFERSFHLLEGDIDYWTDEMILEVQSIGKNIILTLINEPLPVEYCDCCGKGYSHTVKEALVIKTTDPNWEKESICSIYINPENPSLAISIGLAEQHLFSGTLHFCKGTHFHYMCDYYDERIRVKRTPSVRTQATKLVRKIISDWEPAHILIGTGDHDDPQLIDSFTLPSIWERRFSNKKMQPPQKARG